VNWLRFFSAPSKKQDRVPTLYVPLLPGTVPGTKNDTSACCFFFSTTSDVKKGVFGYYLLHGMSLVSVLSIKQYQKVSTYLPIYLRSFSWLELHRPLESISGIPVLKKYKAMKLTILSVAAFLQLHQGCSGFSVPHAGIQSQRVINPKRTSLSAATSLPLDDFVVIPEQVEEESNVGVLLLNLGGPEKVDDVEGMFRMDALTRLSMYMDVLTLNHIISYKTVRISIQFVCGS
jgi:hypothetical protein